MLREFFVDEKITMPFKLFGIDHICLIVFTIISCFLIYYNRNKISNLSEKTKRIILNSVAIIMLLNMVAYYIELIYYGTFDYKIHLPLHLCFISGYLFMYGILFKKEKVLKLTFFLSFVGPLPAIIYPELTSTWNYFEFYEYFISHHFFLIGSFFSYYALNYKIEIKETITIGIIGNVLFIFMTIFNKIFDTNYFFSSGIPEFILDLYPFLRYINPIIVLEVLGLSILTLLYQIVRLRNKELNKKLLNN